MFCSKCGAEVHPEAVICTKCGCAIPRTTNEKYQDPNASPYNWLTALLLCFFIGNLGIHRFYVGKTGTAIIQLLTFGGCGFWALIDFIVIAMGNFTDKDGKPLVNNQ